MRRVKLLCSLIMILTSQSALAVSYPLPPEGSRLVGSPLTITIPQHNTQPLEAFAAQYGQGLSNMLEANPGVDVYLPKSGSTLVVPQQLILPATVRNGIVINVAEMRLYYYPPDGTTVDVLPIGIGRAGRETPVTGSPPWSVSRRRRPGRPPPIPVVNTPAVAKACPRLCPQGRIIPWACTRFTSAGSTRSTAPTPISALACA